jgi:hypothetical protein
MDFSANMKIWKDILTLKPKKAIEKIVAVKNPTFVDGLIFHTIAFLLQVIGSLIIATVITIISMTSGGIALDSFEEVGLGVVLICVLVCLLIMSWTIGSIIMAFSRTIVANALGGKGNFNSLYYATATIYVPIAVISIFVSIISSIVGIIPCVGSIIGWLLVSIYRIYGFYLEILAISKIFNLDPLRSAVAWILPITIIAIFTAIVAVIFAGALIATAIGGLATMQ